MKKLENTKRKKKRRNTYHPTAKVILLLFSNIQTAYVML